MPTANGKIYLGASLVAEPSVQWDGALNTYTIPGSLIQTFTTSGTFTPPVGVTVVHVLVVGGGGNGQAVQGIGGANGGGLAGFGGTGAQPAYYPSVAVGGDVAVTVGGANTGSSFGLLVGPAGGSTYAASFGAHSGGHASMYGWNGSSIQRRHPSSWNGSPGVEINGVFYGAGGLGGNATANGGVGGNAPNGKGFGGGGGSVSSNYTTSFAGGSGGSGVVLIYSEQV